MLTELLYAYEEKRFISGTLFDLSNALVENLETNKLKFANTLRSQLLSIWMWEILNWVTENMVITT